MGRGLEELKAGGLGGSIGEELDNERPDFSSEAAQLLKFHGIYQQDDRDVRRWRAQQGLGKAYGCMVRASIPGGVLSAHQYRALDDLGHEIGADTLRITTRQGLQYHFVTKDDLRHVVGRMNRALVTTLAACGDVARNTMACPAPLPDREAVGISALARTVAQSTKPEVREYWSLWVDGQRAASAGVPEQPNPAGLYGPTLLPRKFKIGIAYPGDNCIEAGSQDIGIVPQVVDGRVVSHTILVGGGLGMSHNNPATYPRLGDPLCSVAPDELVEVVRAIVGIQRDHGDRTNRKHARMKYLVAEWGIERFAGELSQRLGRALRPPAELDWRATDDHLGWHRQADGRWFLGVRVASGRVGDVDGVRLRSALRAVVDSYAQEVRFTPRQDVLLCGIAAGDRAVVDAVLRDHGVAAVTELGPVARHALACPALPSCGLAIAEAERVLPAVVEDLEKVLSEAGVAAVGGPSRPAAGGNAVDDVHVRVTGCPNGCARPYSTEVGIVGRGADHYTVFLGGAADGSRLGEAAADRIPRAELGTLLRPLFAGWVRERHDGERFGDWCHRQGIERLTALMGVTHPLAAKGRRRSEDTARTATPRAQAGSPATVGSRV